MDENNNQKIIRSAAVASFSESVPVPPPPGFVSPYTSIPEWLTAICQGNPPEKFISEYRIIFGGIDGYYIIGLVGYNTYRDERGELHAIDFKPKHAFFPLPKDAYAHFPVETARRRALLEVLAFIKTDEFKNSFLSKAYFIEMDMYEEIWPNFYRADEIL